MVNEWIRSGDPAPLAPSPQAARSTIGSPPESPHDVTPSSEQTRSAIDLIRSLRSRLGQRGAFPKNASAFTRSSHSGRSAQDARARERPFLRDHLITNQSNPSGSGMRARRGPGGPNRDPCQSMSRSSCALITYVDTRTETAVLSQWCLGYPWPEDVSLNSRRVSKIAVKLSANVQASGL
jgi:hypothetical protein